MLPIRLAVPILLLAGAMAWPATARAVGAEGPGVPRASGPPGVQLAQMQMTRGMANCRADCPSQRATTPPPPPPRVQQAAAPPPRSPPPRPARPASPAPPPGIPVGEDRFIADEILIETARSLTAAQFEGLLRRLRLVRLSTEEFPLAGFSLHRLRISDGRPVREVVAALARERGVARSQPNYLFRLGWQVAQATGEASGGRLAPTIEVTPSAPDLPQYAPEKLNLAAAHQLGRGERVLIAVIDSGVDLTHPELAGVIDSTRDVTEAGPWRGHSHGTGMAGAMAAQVRLLGTSPRARLFAIRAFTGDEARNNGASGTTVHILRAIEAARASGARIINMSFAGPVDPASARALAAAREAGIILVAAAGNGGPNARPAFPSVDPNVIAVTATDVDDRLFNLAQRGRHVAVAAPGVDVLVPGPDGGYEMSTGTSVAAAQVSGVIALAAGLDARLDGEGARRLLTATARDLGARGRDDLFGAGLVDAAGVVRGLAAIAPVARR